MDRRDSHRGNCGCGGVHSCAVKTAGCSNAAAAAAARRDSNASCNRSLLRGRLGARRHGRKLHARAPVAHHHLDLAVILLEQGRSRPGHRHRREGHAAASAPVTVEIERLDPVFGWQFYRQVSALVGEGAASVAFVPPAIGEWRAKATYEGSRTSSPSAVGFSYLLVS